MKIRQFVAPTMEQAVKAIRKELGTKAVILHSREVKTGGWFGFFEKRQYQITAGMEVEKSPREEDSIKTPSKSTLQKRLSAHLRQMGVSEGVRNNLMLTANMIENSGISNYSTLLNRVLSSNLHVTCKRPGEKRLLFIAGPTGVGKTTTIAKLAAEEIFMNKKKAAFITLDTYRIAAVDQLKRYGEILESPVHVAYDEFDLMRLCEDEADADIIFIDTAGRNYLETGLSPELLAYLKRKEQAELFVALSLAAKSSDLIQIIDSFDSEIIAGLILTKKDETRSLGTLLELLYHTNLPIGCVTTGQSVPEDICFPDEAKLLNWLSVEVTTANGSSARFERAEE